MTAKQMAQAELVALQQIVDGLKDADTGALEKEIAQAKRIFVGGAGRSLLSMKGFAMRLMQAMKLILLARFAHLVCSQVIS